MNESTLVPREEMLDVVTYLAKNLHKWPESGPTIIPAGDAVFERGANFYQEKVEVIGAVGVFTKDQWLTRRTELQNKPSWNDAPEWATHLAQHSNGRWLFMLSAKVAASLNGWAANRIWSPAGEHGEVLGDWRDTLEKRPEQDEFDPFVSVEDAATAKHPAITPSKYTKTIHGVSVDVYDVLQAWGVSNPALQHLIKKALQCGQRGHKDNAQDLQDIIDSAIRAKELGL